MAFSFVRHRPRDLDEVRKQPRKLKSPQGMAYGYFHGLIPLAAKRYIREVADRMGFTDARAMGIVVLEHKMAVGAMALCLLIATAFWASL